MQFTPRPDRKRSCIEDHPHGGLGYRHGRTAVPTAAHAAPEATVTGAFADSCRDFTAHSSKDISHVEFHRADSLVVKDEAVTTPDYTVDGGSGDEIDVAVVKSGTTTRRLTCESGGPPTALLEIRLTPYCSEPYTSTTGETFYWCRRAAE